MSCTHFVTDADFGLSHTLNHVLFAHHSLQFTSLLAHGKLIASGFVYNLRDISVSDDNNWRAIALKLLTVIENISF